MIFLKTTTVEGVEGATEAAAEAQGPEEGIGPRSLDRKVPAHDPGCLQIREARGHPLLRRQEEALRGCKYSRNSLLLIGRFLVFLPANVINN